MMLLPKGLYEVEVVTHYYLSVNALTQPMQVREEPLHYGDRL